MVQMGTVWDRTSEFLSDNLAQVTPVALIAFFVPASISGSLRALGPNAPQELQLVVELIILALALVQLWGSLAIVAMASEGGEVRHAGALARRRLLPALTVWLVVLLGILLLCAPVFAMLAASGAMPAFLAGMQGGSASLTGDPAASINPAWALPMLLYAIVMVAILLWVAARLAVVSPVIVHEGKWLRAIPRSFGLTRGYALRLIGVLLLYTLIAWVAALAAQTVFGSIFALIAGGDGATLATVLTTIVVAAVQTGFNLLVPVFTAKLYLALTAPL